MSTETDLQTLQNLHAHQTRHDIHPLTCGNDSNHRNLRPALAQDGGVILVCLDCTYVQTHIPEMFVANAVAGLGVTRAEPDKPNILDTEWPGNGRTYREFLTELAQDFEMAVGDKMIGRIALKGPHGNVGTYAGFGSMIRDLLAAQPEVSGVTREQIAAALCKSENGDDANQNPLSLYWLKHADAVLALLPASRPSVTREQIEALPRYQTDAFGEALSRSDVLALFPVVQP